MKKELKITPRIKKQWFRNPKVVFDLIEVVEGRKWNDVTFGNGGGEFIDFKKETVLSTFKTFEGAEIIKEMMEIKNK